MQNDKKLKFDTKFAGDLLICPECELRLFLQLQGHCKKMVHPLLSSREILVFELLYFLSGGINFELAHSTSSLETSAIFNCIKALFDLFLAYYM